MLISMVRRVAPNIIPSSRSGTAAVEVARFLSKDGEVAPIPRVIEPVTCDRARAAARSR